MLRLTALGFTTLIVLAAAGCGGSSEVQDKRGGNNNSTDDTGIVDLKIGETAVKIGGENQSAKLPADFPKDVPIYPGAAVRLVAVRGEGEKAGGAVSLESTDPAAKVAEFYKAEMKSQGWKEATSFDFQAEGKTAVMLGAKKDGRDLALNVSETKDGKTVITITLKGK